MLRFPEYASLQDSPSCLLAGEEKTYELIGKMLQTIGRCLRSRMVIVGMDETHGLGEGRYRQKNGVRRPLDIFLEHLQRVHALARESGLEIALYSDMLFSYSSPRHVYLDPDEAPDPEICAGIPEDAGLIYWDYYSRDPGLLDGMMKRHRDVGHLCGTIAFGLVLLCQLPVYLPDCGAGAEGGKKIPDSHGLRLPVA